MEKFLNDLPGLGNTDFRLIAAALNASSNGVVITDHRQADESIIYCNEAFEQLSGYSKKEIIGHNCRFLQSHDNDQDARREIKQAIATGKHHQVLIRNYRKNGELFWNELMISPVKDQDGGITHFIGIQSDVTKRITAEQELVEQRNQLDDEVRERTLTLQESEMYLSAIVETVRECLVVLDSRLHIISVNRNFCTLFNESESLILGKDLFTIGEGQWDIPELRKLLTQVLPQNNPFEGFELDHDFKFIGRKTLLLNARQMTLKGKYQDNILLALEDITERKVMEYRKEDFINIASHEMRTPLTSIKGNLQLLQKIAKSRSDTVYNNSFTNATAAVDRLEKLIYNLLDVAKMQSGKIDYKFDRLNLSKLITDVIAMTQLKHANYNILFSGIDELTAEGDYGRLEQVMLNLLSNAIKYSLPGSQVKVDITALPESCKVSVTDTGLGIKKQDHERIFERFYRTDEVAEKYPGVGVGLYVCNQIIKEHNGTLWVESTEGKGAKFSFIIPSKR